MIDIKGYDAWKANDADDGDVFDQRWLAEQKEESSMRDDKLRVLASAIADVTFDELIEAERLIAQRRTEVLDEIIATEQAAAAAKAALGWIAPKAKAPKPRKTRSDKNKPRVRRVGAAEVAP